MPPLSDGDDDDDVDVDDVDDNDDDAFKAVVVRGEEAELVPKSRRKVTSSEMIVTNIILISVIIIVTQCHQKYISKQNDGW